MKRKTTEEGEVSDEEEMKNVNAGGDITNWIDPMTTRERVDKVTPLEKFCVIAEDLDRLREHLEMVNGSQSLDDLCEVVSVEELAEKYEIKPHAMRTKLKQAGGKVFKMGKKWVIRKVQFLAVLEMMEETV